MICMCVCKLLGLCPDWTEFSPKNAIANAKQAQDAAEKWLDVPQVRAMRLIPNERFANLSVIANLRVLMQR